MKLVIALLGFALCAQSLHLHAQETNAAPAAAINAAPASIDTLAKDSGILAAGKLIFDKASDFVKDSKGTSGWTFAPYLTYFPNDKGAEKFGGGIFAAYRLNGTVSAGLGLDYLGSLWMPSGNATLQHDFYPLSHFGLTNFSVTPFAIGGIAMPISGAGKNNGGPATIAGGGVHTKVARIKGGDLLLGYAYVNWSSAGIYSGVHHECFVAWKKAF